MVQLMGILKRNQPNPTKKCWCSTQIIIQICMCISYIYIHTIYIFMLTIHTCNMYIYIYTYVGVSLQGCELCQLAVGNTFDSATWFGEKKTDDQRGVGVGISVLKKKKNDQIWGRDILGTSSSSMTFF